MPESDLLNQLEAVQRGLRRTGREMVLSGSQALVRGLFVLAGCGASLLLLERPWWYMAGLWAATALLIVASEAFLYLRLARKSPDKFVTGVERQLLKFVFLVAVTGVVLSAVLVKREQADLIPGIWMLLVGAAYVAVGLFSFSRTWVLGLCASLGGAAALFLEPAYSLAVLGLVLGVGSMAWAAIVRIVERTVE